MYNSNNKGYLDSFCLYLQVSEFATYNWNTRLANISSKDLELWLFESFINTGCVQKVLRILCFCKNYLFIHEYLFCPLQSNPHQLLYTCANLFFPILEALQKIMFCDLVQLLLRCRLYLFKRMIELWCPRHNHKPMIRHQLWPSGANLGRRG